MSANGEDTKPVKIKSEPIGEIIASAPAQARAPLYIPQAPNLTHAPQTAARTAQAPAQRENVANTAQTHGLPFSQMTAEQLEHARTTPMTAAQVTEYQDAVYALQQSQLEAPARFLAPAPSPAPSQARNVNANARIRERELERAREVRHNQMSAIYHLVLAYRCLLRANMPLPANMTWTMGIGTFGEDAMREMLARVPG